jgi:hypothetical protein
VLRDYILVQYNMRSPFWHIYYIILLKQSSHSELPLELNRLPSLPEIPLIPEIGNEKQYKMLRTGKGLITRMCVFSAVLSNGNISLLVKVQRLSSQAHDLCCSAAVYSVCWKQLCCYVCVCVCVCVSTYPEVARIL